ncbi:MAG: addiction module toxin RelE [Prevotellaceae bacterium]|jgi:mRNA-degrading endonuclease RelE of RelBE toxin-antitoxin system|nr:addiction module toxin RelE [Prevotellaceae bacterium]
MTSFIPTTTFERSYKRLKKKYPSLSSDLKEFEAQLIQNPKAGVDLGGRFRKVRVAIASKGAGKRGGARIITYDLLVQECNQVFILVDIYDKSERSSMLDSEYKAVVKEFLNKR